MAVSIRESLRNRLSIVGAIITTLAALVFVVTFLLDLFGLHTNPYLGILFFLIIPGIFLLGLFLIPLGAFLERRRRARGIETPHGWPRIDLNNPSTRRAVTIALVLTLVNVVIISLAAYRGIEFMDSPEFCGQVCHEVMQPEYVAYQDGPHSRVACVRCHIGPGASWFAKSKIDGSRQVVAVLFNTHSRPIASPVHDLRPARDTCEQCHWPEKFHGDTISVKKEYADDEAVTESVTTLRIHVGGGSDKLGVAAGIHWHMSIANQIDYISTDPRRLEIPYVEFTDRRSGQVRKYFVEGVTQQQLEAGERRRMDCIDCHNRPSHPFSASPERAIDGVIASGELPKLPFVRREAVAALKVDYPDTETALREIAARIGNFYLNNYADINKTRRPEIDRAIEVAQRTYGRNVFPKMNVGWGTHPNHIGHTDAPGCFRCHDDKHKTTDGRVIRQDCDLCHDFQ